MKVKTKLIFLSIFMLALAVIIIPMLFEENIFSQHIDAILAKFPALPKAPKFKTYTTTEIKQNELSPDSIEPLVTAWVIEVYPANKDLELQNLISSLQSQGYTAFLQTDDAQYTHVFIGPELNKHEAEVKSKAITELLQFKTRLIKYDELKI